MTVQGDEPGRSRSGFSASGRRQAARPHRRANKMASSSSCITGALPIVDEGHRGHRSTALCQSAA